MTWSLCIFAHNEARLLPQCIGALDAASGGGDFRAHILVNGATDNTEKIANTLAAADRRLTVHCLPIADKANAWNDYVHRIAGASADVHFFIDGDVTPSALALSHMAQTLNASPRAYGVAALPATGRSRREMAINLVANAHLAGNLYGLSRAALLKIRDQHLRLPFGAKGEDGLLAYLLLTDLKGGSDDSHTDRLAVAGRATFEFTSLSFSRRDVAIYHRRLLRYSERHFQKLILYRLLKQQGVRAMPDNIYDIYTDETLAALKPRRNPINFWYDCTVLKKLRQNRRIFPHPSLA